MHAAPVLWEERRSAAIPADKDDYMRRDATTDPALRSWVPVERGSDFPIQNLPYGTFVRASERARIGVAIGSSILALDAVAEAGLLDGICADARGVFGATSLNGLLACGRAAWRATRERISRLLSAGDQTLQAAGIAERAVLPQRSVALTLPIEAGDYVDFYSSLEHATNVGRIFRPSGDALPPNWRHLPIGYHGRSASIVSGGTAVRRPRGQINLGTGSPLYEPSRALDFELELAFVTGNGPEPPAPIPVSAARDYIFGLALLNDWSARDMQTWEYQPLGPFLAKSFATSLSPWIVTFDALEPYRVAGPVQEPAPLPHLASSAPEAYDISLEVALTSEAMRARETTEQTITRTNFRGMYWSMAQQLAHLSSNGSRVRAGDVFGSGTISGAGPKELGSLLELTWRGERPLILADGTQRSFLADGDEVVMRAWCEAQDRARVGFGELRGRVLAASAS